MIAQSYINTKGRSRFLLVVTAEEMEILQGLIRKAEMHTPKIPKTERLLGRLMAMRRVINKVFGDFKHPENSIQINETAFVIDKEAFLKLQ